MNLKSMFVMTCLAGAVAAAQADDVTGPAKGSTDLGVGSSWTTAVSNSALPSATTLAASARRDPSTDDYSTDSRKRLPWYVSVGVFIPSSSISGFSNNSGAEFAIGYRYPLDFGDLRISSRGQAFSSSFNGVDGDGNPVTGSETVAIDVISLEALYRAGALYFGPGIGFGTASALAVANTSNGTGVGTASESITEFSFAVGYDFSTHFFAEARWQSLNDSSLNGYSIGLGYRF